MVKSPTNYGFHELLLSKSSNIWPKWPLFKLNVLNQGVKIQIHVHELEFFLESYALKSASEVQEVSS